jgi:hypothetical protein
MSKPKLKTQWAPFPHEYSSCSSLKPEDFEWSRNEGIANVWIDNQIMKHVGTPENNFGWFCESSEVLPGLKDFLSRNLSVVRRRFKKIYTCDHDLISLDPSFFIFNPPGSNLPWTPRENYRIPDKTKICSMISSSKDMTTGHKLRLRVAREIKNMVDLFGGAHGSTRIGSGIGPNGDWWRSKEEALTPYMFSVVFENIKIDKYYTEKITDCFALGVIPIYWGTDKISEDFNSEGIIRWSEGFDFNTLTKELYDSKIEFIKDNLERVKKLKSSDDLLFNQIKNNV